MIFDFRKYFRFCKGMIQKSSKSQTWILLPSWNKKLQSSEIISIEEIPYHRIREFSGLGGRIGRGRKNGKWRIGYVMWLQKGIEIEATNGKYYVFGTDNPQEILSLIQ